MYYPMTDYIALALIISFLFLTLFICLLLDWPPESPDNQYHLFK